MKIIIVLITGAGIFISVKILAFLLAKRNLKHIYWKKLRQAFPLIEIIIWTIYGFWITEFLFKENTFYPYITGGLVLIIAALTAWFFFRDVFAGAIFKIQNDLNKGDYIKTGSISGQIKSVNLTSIEIISDEGQTIKIPNSKLSQDLISGMNTPEGLEEFNIHLEVDKRFTKQEIEHKIKYEIANSAWSNFKNPPVIKLHNDNGKTYTYDVLVYTLNHQHFSAVEKTLKEKLEFIEE